MVHKRDEHGTPSIGRAVGCSGLGECGGGGGGGPSSRGRTGRGRMMPKVGYSNQRGSREIKGVGEGECPTQTYLCTKLYSMRASASNSVQTLDSMMCLVH